MQATNETNRTRGRTKKVVLAVVAVVAAGAVATFLLVHRAHRLRWYCGGVPVELCVAANACPSELDGFGCHAADTAFCASSIDVSKILMRDAGAPWPCFETAAACDDAAAQINAGADEANASIARKTNRPAPPKNTPAPCAEFAPADAP